MRSLRVYLITLFISFLLFGLPLFYSLKPLYEETWPEEAVTGKRIWQEKGCVECHTLLGNGGYSGGDLTFVTVTKTKEELLAFLTSPPVIPPAKKLRHIALDPEQAKSVISFLEKVSEIDTHGWPPKPSRNTSIQK